MRETYLRDVLSNQLRLLLKQFLLFLNFNLEQCETITLLALFAITLQVAFLS